MPVCAPSIANQTVQTFEWLVFFDPETPTDALDRFWQIVGHRTNVRVCFCEEWNREAIVASINTIAEPGIDWIVSTRLDNDDGLHENFVSRLHAEVRVGQREFLNYPLGYVVANDCAYLYRHESNAFISFSEPMDGVQTPFVMSHELLSDIGPVRQIEAPPYFYQLVHGGNFSNKVRGTRVPIAEARRGCENLKFALPGEDTDPAWKIRLENVTLGTLRGARDRALNIYKRIRGTMSAPTTTKPR